MKSKSQPTTLTATFPSLRAQYHTFEALLAPPTGFTTSSDPANETNTTYIEKRWYFQPHDYKGEFIFSDSYACRYVAEYALDIWLVYVRNNQAGAVCATCYMSEPHKCSYHSRNS